MEGLALTACVLFSFSLSFSYSIPGKRYQILLTAHAGSFSPSAPQPPGCSATIRTREDLQHLVFPAEVFIRCTKTRFYQPELFGVQSKGEILTA